MPAGEDQSNSLNSGRFLDISGGPGEHPPFLETHGNSGRLGRSAYTFKERNNLNSFHKKTFTNSLGGHGPRAPWLGHWKGGREGGREVGWWDGGMEGGKQR